MSKPRENEITPPTPDQLEEIRRLHREFERLDWPDTVRLGIGGSAEQRLVIWWQELRHRLRRMTAAEYRRLLDEDLEHHLRTAERARRLAPRG